MKSSARSEDDRSCATDQLCARSASIPGELHEAMRSAGLAASPTIGRLIDSIIARAAAVVIGALCVAKIEAASKLGCAPGWVDVVHDSNAVRSVVSGSIAAAFASPVGS